MRITSNGKVWHYPLIGRYSGETGAIAIATNEDSIDVWSIAGPHYSESLAQVAQYYADHEQWVNSKLVVPYYHA